MCKMWNLWRPRMFTTVSLSETGVQQTKTKTMCLKEILSLKLEKHRDHKLIQKMFLKSKNQVKRLRVYLRNHINFNIWPSERMFAWSSCRLEMELSQLFPTGPMLAPCEKSIWVWLCQLFKRGPWMNADWELPSVFCVHHIIRDTRVLRKLYPLQNTGFASPSNPDV